MVKKSVKHWKEVAREAQRYRDSTIARIQPPVPEKPIETPKNVFDTLRSFLSPEEIEITELSPQALLERLRTRRLAAVVVTNAFLRRAGVAQRLTNCITEVLPERALARARFLDEYIEQNGKPFGVLHGLPISVKEHLGMEGLGLNAGYVAWWDKVATEDARVLKILSRAGAVFHARTTEPQTIMHLETDSNLYGVTVNPYNTDTSAGGSSGGEGALIGTRGSCLGIGTDVGGSIRSPAANNGIYGLKPTAFRIPTDGWSSIAPGADPIPTVIGPLSTSIDGLKLFMHTILSSQPWLHEPALVPLPWNASYRISPQQPLKIGIMWHDGVVQPHPPITRALETVAGKLASVPNVETVDWRPHLHDEAWAITSTLYYPDGGAEDAEVLAASGEPWRPLTTWLLRENPCVKKLQMRELWYWLEEREAYRSEYAAVWNGTASRPEEKEEEEEDPETGRSPGGMVDAILCPVGPGVAPRHDTARYWCYTSQWNLLDYPAVSFPVCKVEKGPDGGKERKEFLGDLDRENWKLWDPETFDGLPVSLQLVGRRFEDEKIVAILEHMSKEIGLPFAHFP